MIQRGEKRKDRKERRKVVGAATAHMEGIGQFPPLELHTLLCSRIWDGSTTTLPFFETCARGGELCLV